jgi:alpha-D-xyloside xylohydrolase
LFVREGTILVLGQAEGEGGFGYDWLSSGGEVRLYGVKEGNKAVLVDTNGDEKGVLEVDTSGELTGLDALSGDWQVSKLG